MSKNMLAQIHLGRALDFRKPILNYVNENEDLAEYALAPSEWAALKQVSDWLKSYRYATTKMSTTKQPMLSMTHAVFRLLQDELKAAIAALPSTADPALLEGLVAARRKLSDYFTKFDESRYYFWATHLFSYISIKHILFLIPPSILDPRLSYEALRKEYADDSELLAGLEKSKAGLKSISRFSTPMPSHRLSRIHRPNHRLRDHR
jgi:hypothetical protein